VVRPARLGGGRGRIEPGQVVARHRRPERDRARGEQDGDGEGEDREAAHGPAY
jgi:hypothetical protein